MSGGVAIPILLFEELIIEFLLDIRLSISPPSVAPGDVVVVAVKVLLGEVLLVVGTTLIRAADRRSMAKSFTDTDARCEFN